MAYLGPRQLVPTYKRRLEEPFLKWYAATFRAALNIYVHWSAGPYDVEFSDYHYCIHGDGKLGLTFAGNPFDAIKAHTYARNHGAVGIGVLAMQNATSDNYGPCPVTIAQLHALVTLCAQIACNYRIPVGNILTHAEAGDNKDYSDPNGADCPHDPYGPEHDCERWDFWEYLRTSDLHLTTARLDPDAGLTAGSPDGYLYMPDWLRGEVALAVQEMTRAHWDPSTASKGG